MTTCPPLHTLSTSRMCFREGHPSVTASGTTGSAESPRTYSTIELKSGRKVNHVRMRAVGLDRPGGQAAPGWSDRPSRVFHDKQHRLLGGDAHQNRQEGVQGLLLLLFGRSGQGGIALGQWDGQEGGEERHGLCQRQAILHRELLQVTELLWRKLLPLKAQRHPLQQIKDRIQGRNSGNTAITGTASAMPAARWRHAPSAPAPGSICRCPLRH